MKVLIEGRLQTGSYTNKDGVKIYTTDVIAESVEFAESKREERGRTEPKEETEWATSAEDVDLPFN